MASENINELKNILSYTSDNILKLSNLIRTLTDKGNFSDDDKMFIKLNINRLHNELDYYNMILNKLVI